MGSNATAKAPQVFSLGCQKVKPRDSEGSFPMAFISYSSSLRELQGLLGVWGVTAPVSWEMFRNHTQHIEYTEEGLRKYPSLWTQTQYINQVKCCSTLLHTWANVPCKAKDVFWMRSQPLLPHEAPWILIFYTNSYFTVILYITLQ